MNTWFLVIYFVCILLKCSTISTYSVYLDRRYEQWYRRRRRRLYQRQQQQQQLNKYVRHFEMKTKQTFFYLVHRLLSILI